MPREIGDRELPPVRHCETYKGNTGQPGPRGDGADAASSNIPGISGRKFVQDPANQNDDFYAEHLTPIAGRLFLRQAVMAHINGEYEEAAQRLSWLHTLLRPDTPRMHDSSPFIDADLPNEKVVADIEFDALRKLTVIQWQRLRMGLDAYGNSPSFVPMLNFKAYDEYITRWLESARRVETLHDQYFYAGRTQDQKLEDVRGSLKHLDVFMVNLDHDIKTFQQNRTKLQDDILKLLTEAEKLYADLMQAAESFKNAVAAESGCSFMDTVKAVATIAALVKGGPAAAAAVRAALDAVADENKALDDKDSIKGITKYFETISEKFEVVSGKADEVVVAYNKIKGLLNRNDNLKLPTDRAKIIAERDEIAKTVEKFRHLPQAGGYLQAIDNFISVVTTRNGKIVEHDVLALKTAEAEGKIAQAKMDKINIQDKLSKEISPFLPAYEEFMARNLDMHKAELVRALHYAQRALAYMTLTDERPDYARQTVAHLEHTQRLLNEGLLKAKEAKGRSHQTLNLGHHVGTFSLKKLTETEIEKAEGTQKVKVNGIDKLKNKARISFSIPEDAFPDYYHVYVTNIRVTFNDVAAKPDKPPGILLVHSGHAKFTDRRGYVREFQHEARPTMAYAGQAANTGGSLGNDDEFIALSPYGPWIADINLGANKDIDFTRMSDVKLEFELKYMPKF